MNQKPKPMARKARLPRMLLEVIKRRVSRRNQNLPLNTHSMSLIAEVSYFVKFQRIFICFYRVWPAARVLLLWAKRYIGLHKMVTGTSSSLSHLIAW